MDSLYDTTLDLSSRKKHSLVSSKQSDTDCWACLFCTSSVTCSDSLDACEFSRSLLCVFFSFLVSTIENIYEGRQAAVS